MSEPAQLGLDAAPQADASPIRRSKWGAALAAVIAGGASAGLAWWVGSPDRAHPPAPEAPAAGVRVETRPAPPPVLTYATASADMDQIRRAHAEERRIRAAGGLEALFRTSVSCGKTLAGDPSVLDFCLAFDVYAARAARRAPPDAPARTWFAAAPDRDLALARAALPQTADAKARLARDRALAISLIPKPRPHPKPAPAVESPPPVQAVAREPPPRASHRPVHHRVRHHPAAKLRHEGAEPARQPSWSENIDRFLRRLVGVPPLHERREDRPPD